MENGRGATILSDIYKVFPYICLINVQYFRAFDCFKTFECITQLEFERPVRKGGIVVLNNSLSVASFASSAPTYSVRARASSASVRLLLAYKKLLDDPK